jgi:hypothetical protein
MLGKFAKTNQSKEYLINTVKKLNFIKNALSIDIKNKFNDEESPTLTEIENLQNKIKKDIEDTSLLYFIFNPKELLKAYW